MSTNSNIFTVKYTEDVSKAGSYTLSYLVSLEKYPQNFEEMIDAFTFTVIDPCASPNSLTMTQ